MATITWTMCNATVKLPPHLGLCSGPDVPDYSTSAGTRERKMCPLGLRAERAHDRGKVGGLEAGSANQRSIDVGLGGELRRVRAADAAAVLDAQRRGDISAVRLSDHAADEGRHLLRCHARRGPPRADGPQR